MIFSGFVETTGASHMNISLSRMLGKFILDFILLVLVPLLVAFRNIFLIVLKPEDFILPFYFILPFDYLIKDGKCIFFANLLNYCQINIKTRGRN